MRRPLAQWTLAPRLLSSVVIASALATSVPVLAQTAKPDAAATAEAKKKFDAGLKLYKEGSYREALAAFLAAKALAPRESIQRNIAQCYRELKDFASAYEAYRELLDTFGAKIKKSDADQYNQALDDLRTLTGAIRIGSGESGAKVTIDDRDVGTTPLAKPVRVNIGTHKIVLTKSGFEPLTKSIEIKGGDEATVDATMQREPQTGHVVVTAEGEAAGAKLVVDGTEVGALPWEGDLPPGPHSLELRGPNIASQTKQIEVTKGQRTEVSMTAASTLGRVVVEGGSPEAHIFIDDREVGLGAWEGSLTPGKHDLRVTRLGYENVDRVFVVRPGESLAIRDIAMEKSVVAVPQAPYDYTGVYGQIHLLGAFGSSTSDISKSCPAENAGGSCDSSFGLGGGLGFRIGYNFEWVGVEAFGIGSYQQLSDKATYPNDVPPTAGYDIQGVARTEEYTFHRYGADLGAAVRLTSENPTVRFTGALGGGMAIRGMAVKRKALATNDSQNTSDSFTSSDSYKTPMAIADVGVLLGASPGVKFHLGIVGMLEFIEVPPFASADSGHTLGNASAAHAGGLAAKSDGSILLGTPSFKMAQGTQVFFGPVLGLQFGQ